jgi:glycosyltransferase involved in cell wall biosynthesis
MGNLGLAECLQILIGEDHTSDRGMEIAKHIYKLFKKKCAQYKEKYQLNFGVYNTPAENLSHTALKRFREKYGIGNKKVVLGVAFDWGKRKGLDVFCKLADTLPKDYQIVLVGTNDEIDMTLPKNIISIHRTANQRELAEIYSASDVFANPTREDTFPTVNMEAIACGTPIVTFKTGGSPEIIDGTCGSVVDVDNVDGFYNEIVRVCEDKPYSKEACVERAKKFDRNDKFKEYIELFEYKSKN